MVLIRPLQPGDADALYALVTDPSVTAGLLWDGPESYEEYCAGIAERAEKTRNGEVYEFAIVERASRCPMGMIGIRPYREGFRADLGIWIGTRFQGRGYGSMAIGLAAGYGFLLLGLEKLEAYIFTNNHPSRRAFEKNGFRLEGTIRRAVRKQDILHDEWVMGLLPEEFVPPEIEA
ncbi:MAG TPA: GNAT family N-acetyltransferase [Bryobacteraceae bacterium]|jgi:RimJ/RimL family protein N-acetyltransferase|nr:GNAT family N-acetyltransferase [Bryobacteraceae bacterium]